jgi:molybdopterin-containing oxidoreductase family iron-sulfur binding subunit
MGNQIDKEPLNLAVIRARLAATRGRQYWRSLEELAETAEFQELLHREFPRQAAEWGAISRRQFLKLMAASLALAGLSSCGGPPAEKIEPYVKAPAELVPGEPLFYATAMTLGGYAVGLLARSNQGRPTKIEGNPDHPASLGATDAFAQAALLTLYDPDRSQSVMHIGTTSTWDAFQAAIGPAIQAQGASGGAGLRILTETVTSPTLGAQLQALLAAFPAARWHQYEPAGRDTVRAGAWLAFGQDVNVIYRLDQAAAILALDADFLFDEPGRLPYARAFSDGRRIQDGRTEMNRLYVVESTPTITGAVADHRLPLHPSQIEGFTRAVAAALGVDVGPGGFAAPPGVPAAWLAALVRDLQAHRGASIVIAGLEQPPIVHALTHAINAALGNAGRTVVYTAPVATNPTDQHASLRELVADMQAGRVQLLAILGGNPAYTAPADLDFAGALAQVGISVHLNLYHDETAALCQWHIPEAHALEAWSDARAFDGTATIIQPLIAPLYDGKTHHELIAALLGQTSSSYQIVHDYWQRQRPAGGPSSGSGQSFEQFWRTALHDGVIPGTAAPTVQVALKPGFASQSDASPVPADTLELIFRPDPAIWDGRFANNGWLQELPRPLTSLTWDNVALVGPALAERMGLANEDVIELSYRGRSLRAPVWIAPGHADGAVTVTLGYGRTHAGRVGDGVGYNAYAIRTSDAPWFGAGLAIRKAGERHALASVQGHFSVEGRDLARSGTLADYQRDPHFAQQKADQAAPPSLYPNYTYDGNAWGMTIDLNACIGCNACVLACQAENNIPIVGKEQVQRNREMHWLRIDSYRSGDLDNPEAAFQPRFCMHCEHAPCELVCPVGATVHDSEGLNVMVYNRCIGTRYCSNNCPYKVRRFNFLAFADKQTPVIQLMYNPEVTVRDRGVMEKCTYCVQRISAARIAAERENRPIRDGEIQTACQQVCPTQALTFGNINDLNSRVAQLKAGPLNYGMLAELGTRPRTTYLARLRNPNPEIGEEHNAAGT